MCTTCVNYADHRAAAVALTGLDRARRLHRVVFKMTFALHRLGIFVPAPAAGGESIFGLTTTLAP
jgi:hypothetical protein